MSRAWFAAFAVLLVASCNESAVLRQHEKTEDAAAVEKPCLSIVAWNDVHGQLAPDEPVMDTGRLPAGGVVALADEVASIRATGDTVVVLDAGDLFTGPLESTLAEGAPIIDAFAAIGVDAAAIGNHEFDFGPAGYAQAMAKPGVGDEAGADGPRGALFARMASAPFPFLSANLHRVGGAATGWRGHKPSTSIDRGGYRVGVVGYTTQETPTTTLKPNVEGLDFASGAGKSVAESVRALRASGAAPIILLAHASLEGELPQSLDDPKDPRGEKRVGEIATLLASMGDDLPDAIVAGHRHAWLLGRVKGIPIVSSDQHGVGLARLRYCALPRDAGPPALQSIERRAAIAHSPPLTPLGAKVEAVVAPWRAAVKKEADAIVAKIPRTCLAQGLNGTAFGEQVARSVAERVSDAAKPPEGVPVVAVINSGGLRAPLLAGPLRFADLFAAFPFENAVSVCATTKAGLARMLGNASSKSSTRERFPFGIAGARVKLKRTPAGTLQVASVDVKGAEKDTDRVWLAIPDFLLWGGDAFLDGVTCTSTATSATRVRDAWRALLEREQGGCDGAPKNLAIE